MCRIDNQSSAVYQNRPTIPSIYFKIVKNVALFFGLRTGAFGEFAAITLSLSFDLILRKVINLKIGNEIPFTAHRL